NAERRRPHQQAHDPVQPQPPGGDHDRTHRNYCWRRGTLRMALALALGIAANAGCSDSSETRGEAPAMASLEMGLSDNARRVYEQCKNDPFIRNCLIEEANKSSPADRELCDLAREH